MIILTLMKNLSGASGKVTKKSTQEFSDKIAKKLRETTGADLSFDSQYGLITGKDHAGMVTNTVSTWDQKVYEQVGSVLRQFKAMQYEATPCMPEELLKAFEEYDPDIAVYLMRLPQVGRSIDWYRRWKENILKAAKALNNIISQDTPQVMVSVDEKGGVEFSVLIGKERTAEIIEDPAKWAILEFE